jgi:hypothetical protein
LDESANDLVYSAQSNALTYQLRQHKSAPVLSVGHETKSRSRLFVVEIAAGLAA